MKSVAVANNTLAPIIRHCERERGAKSELHRRLNRVLDEPVTYRSVCRWLEPDEKKRVEPLLGVGLVLISTFKAMARKDGK